MKFKGIRKFGGNSLAEVVKYLAVDISIALKDLFSGLGRLSFADNFQSFETTVTIAAGTEKAIPNYLGTQALKRIIVRQTGNALITDGDTAWTDNFVYLKNNGSNSVTATVIFMR